MDRLGHRRTTAVIDLLERPAQLRQALANQPDTHKPGWHDTQRAIRRQVCRECPPASWRRGVRRHNVPGSNNNLVLSDKERIAQERTHSGAVPGGQCRHNRADAANIDWLRSGSGNGQQHAASVWCFSVIIPILNLPETEDVDEAPCRSTGLSCPDAGTDRADRAVRWPGIASAR